MLGAFGRIALEHFTNPEKLAQAQAGLLSRNLSVLGAFLSDAAEGHDKPARDRRFKDSAWSQETSFRLLRDLYLANSDWLLDTVRGAQQVGAQDKRKALFYARQLLSALSPANFILTNPQALEAARATGGESVARGLENLIRDIERGGGQIAITQTDERAFEVGRDLATTPGKVVYRNDLIELIQYAPTTGQVWKRPLLFVPPWINKYYIVDLRPENSFLRWFVDQGHTVFVISWVNPGAEHRGKSFDNYLLEGPLAAIDVVREITGEPEVNVGGFCIGGILLLCALACLSARGEVPVRSATLLATMVDLRENGECGVFIDEPQIAKLEKHAGELGYLDGQHLKEMFSMLRENELIWNYVVSNYLLGRDPPAFDLLYWNADCTRLPAAMLGDYLRKICLGNALARAGRMVLDGVPIDLRKVRTPCYFLSTIDDHIAPWRATYPVTRMLSGPCEFVLGGSGHIAGIVNPPAKRKYSYQTRADHPPDAGDWLQGSQRHEGSWWPHWAAWLADHGGSKVPARAPGSGTYPPLAAAPGRYVLER